MKKYAVNFSLALALFVNPHYAAAQGIFADNFSGGINSANWIPFGTSPNALSTSSGSLQVIGPGEAGFFNAGLQLNMNTVGGNVAGDFTASLNFLFSGESGDVVVFQALFADGNTLNEYYMGSSPNYIFALNGNVPSVTSGNINVIGNSGIFSITRSVSAITAYFNGASFFSMIDSSPLTGIDLNYASIDGSLGSGNVLATFNSVSLDPTSAPEPAVGNLAIVGLLIWLCHRQWLLNVKAQPNSKKIHD